MVRLARMVLPLALLLGAAAAHADTVTRADAASGGGAARPGEAWFTTRVMMPGEVLHEGDLELRPLATPLSGLFDADSSPAQLEVRHRLMSGRPLMARDVGRHAVVRANSDVRVVWRSGAIAMQMDGRALQDGAAGDEIRVINTMSAHTLRGVVLPDGSVQVGSGQ